MEFTHDRQLQMRSLHLHAKLHLRPRRQGLRLRPVVQVREVRLREMTGRRRCDDVVGRRHRVAPVEIMRASVPASV